MKSKILIRSLSIILALALLVGISACGKTIGTGDGKEAVVRQDTTEEVTAESTTNKETTNTAETTTAQQTTNGNDQSGGYVPEDSDEPSGGYVPDDPIETPTEPSTEAPTDPTDPPAPTWTISVTIDAGAYGGIFGNGVFTFSYQPTAYDALVATDVPCNVRSTLYGIYVVGINGLSEKDQGPKSGWLYAVNGIDPSVSCSDYYLEDGDTVYWHYTDDYTQE